MDSCAVAVLTGKTRPPAVAPSSWCDESTAKRPTVAMRAAQTMQQAFLENTHHMGAAVAVADDISGVLTYEQVRIGALLLASYVQANPEIFKGKHVGVMMPASAGVGLLVRGQRLTQCRLVSEH